METKVYNIQFEDQTTMSRLGDQYNNKRISPSAIVPSVMTDFMPSFFFFIFHSNKKIVGVVLQTFLGIIFIQNILAENLELRRFSD